MRDFLEVTGLISLMIAIIVGVVLIVGWSIDAANHTDEKRAACAKIGQVYYMRLDACVNADQPWLEK